MERFFFCVLLITLVQQGSSQLKCHQCTTLVTDDCLDPYIGSVRADDYVDDCSDSDTHCTKFKTVVSIADSGYITGKERVSTVVTRACGSHSGEADGCKLFPTNGGYYVRCICSGSDECNAAPNLQLSLVAAVLSSLVVLFQWLC